MTTILKHVYNLTDPILVCVSTKLILFLYSSLICTNCLCYLQNEQSVQELQAFYTAPRIRIPSNIPIRYIISVGSDFALGKEVYCDMDENM